MYLEPAPPKELKKVQQWFAQIITRPIDSHSRMNLISPSGQRMEIEATKYIAPSPTLSSAQRIEIYNQQYWWRLLANLQETFPLLVRLFGYTDFNQKIGFPYLERYLPNHWSLSYLGSRLPYWTQRYYVAEDKKLVHLSAVIDYAYIRSFTAKPCSFVTGDALEELMETTLYLQPHIFLYQLAYPFFEFRDQMLEEPPEHWEENPFPGLKKEPVKSYIVWRDCANHVGWTHLDNVEFHVLKQFQKGTSFSAICEWLETQPRKIYESACDHLQTWTHRWVVNEWLTMEQASSFSSKKDDKNYDGLQLLDRN